MRLQIALKRCSAKSTYAMLVQSYVTSPTALGLLL